MTGDQFFYRLTPDAVMDAVEQAGFTPSGRWLQLNSMENRVFSIQLEEAVAGVRHLVAKFYRPGRWNLQQICEEHRFLEQLREAEIPVCHPLETANGVEPAAGHRLRTVSQTEGIYYALWPRTGGRMPDEFDEEQMHTIGRLVGRIHRTGMDQTKTTRPQFDSGTRINRPLEFLLANSTIPSHCRERYAAAAAGFAELCRDELDPLPRLRIHGDCHPGNLLHNGENFFFLDFDDFTVGPAVQDFWMVLRERGSGSRRMQLAFLEGYRLFAPAEERWLRLTELLRGIRYIHYAAWVAERWEDPAFPALLPHFGTVHYWEQETADLEQQLITAREELYGTRDPQSGSQQKLTNKDYFWDMD